MFKILIAEDDENLKNIIASTLRKENYTVLTAANGKEAADVFYTEKVDLVITDIMMPIFDGNQLCEIIKKTSADLPVIMLTALETIDDKEKGFNSGADDYLTKPFALKELLLCVKAMLRRYGKAHENKIVLKHTELDYATLTVLLNGKNVELAKKEFLLLFKLLSHPNVIFSREQLMDDIWGYDNDSTDRTVDTHIKWLRDKVPSDDFHIVTIRGIGYKAVLTQ